MDGNSFLNAFMPTLPWWFLATGLLTAWAFLARAWIRRWNAQRRQVENPGKALAIARDALATVISDPLAGEETRKQAVDAYDAVTVATTSSRKTIR
jgi:hypothetical protein